jgi:hypothetical protein
MSTENILIPLDIRHPYANNDLRSLFVSKKCELENVQVFE